MARPRGFRLSRFALGDLLAAKRLTMTEVAQLAGLPLTTVSGLAQGDHRASMKTVRQLAEGVGCEAETLFPELAFTDMREVVG
jgi:transcriptional regulator with XRE-family HTH domain